MFEELFEVPYLSNILHYDIIRLKCIKIVTERDLFCYLIYYNLYLKLALTHHYIACYVIIRRPSIICYEHTFHKLPMYQLTKHRSEQTVHYTITIYTLDYNETITIYTLYYNNLCTYIL